VTLEAAINGAVKKAQRKDARALRRASGRHFPCLNCPGEERICNDKDDDPADDE
jgi:hypothetical protein